MMGKRVGSSCRGWRVAREAIKEMRARAAFAQSRRRQSSKGEPPPAPFKLRLFFLFFFFLLPAVAERRLLIPPPTGGVNPPSLFISPPAPHFRRENRRQKSWQAIGNERRRLLRFRTTLLLQSHVARIRNEKNKKEITAHPNISIFFVRSAFFWLVRYIFSLLISLILSLSLTTQFERPPHGSDATSSAYGGSGSKRNRNSLISIPFLFWYHVLYDRRKNNAKHKANETRKLSSHIEIEPPNRKIAELKLTGIHAQFILESVSSEGWASLIEEPMKHRYSEMEWTNFPPQKSHPNS